MASVGSGFSPSIFQNGDYKVEDRLRLIAWPAEVLILWDMLLFKIDLTASETADKDKEVRRSRKVGYHKIYMLFTVSINGHDRFLVPDVSITTAREDIALPLTYCAVKGTLAMKTSLGLIGTPAKRGRPSASDVPMTLLHMIVRGSSSMIYVRTTSQIRRQSWKPSGYDETALDARVLGFYYLKRDPE